MSKKFDVIIIVACAAGLMYAIKAGKRNKKVLIVEHGSKIAEKIRISGEEDATLQVYIVVMKIFCQITKIFVSAFSKYTQNDFVDLVKKHKIKFYEKKLGQLFCDNSAKDII